LDFQYKYLFSLISFFFLNLKDYERFITRSRLFIEENTTHLGELISNAFKPNTLAPWPIQHQLYYFQKCWNFQKIFLFSEICFFERKIKNLMKFLRIYFCCQNEILKINSLFESGSGQDNMVLINALLHQYIQISIILFHKG